MALTQAQRGKVIGAIAIVAVLAGTIETTVAGRMASSRAKDLRADLVRAYRGTTVADVGLLGFDEQTLDRSGHSPDIAAQVDAGVRAKYRVRALTTSRCVVVLWDDDGVDVSQVTGC